MGKASHTMVAAGHRTTTFCTLSGVTMGGGDVLISGDALVIFDRLQRLLQVLGLRNCQSIDVLAHANS